MTPGRRRPLTPAERRLWAEVARQVAPLKGRALPAEAAAPLAANLQEPVEPALAIPAAPTPRQTPGSRPVLPPLAPLDRKTSRALSRGRRRADASIDLHGLDQAAAYGALIRFLRRSQSEGHGLVMVVTGKGRPGDAMGSAGERGVLRRVAPLWLTSPELRAVVLGIDTAGPHQGGEGALYVRLRRRRTANS